MIADPVPHCANAATAELPAAPWLAGLPVVNEWLDGEERLAKFRAELEWTNQRSKKRRPLQLTYVGNKQLGPDGVWVRPGGDIQGKRSSHGHVQVTVDLINLGTYYIRAPSRRAKPSGHLTARGSVRCPHAHPR